MTTAGELFREGRLDEAVQVATSVVKRQPADFGARFLLAELLLFTGDLERADKHFDTAATVEPKLALQATLLRHLLRGEQARRDFYMAGRIPEVFVPPDAELGARIRASIAIRAGDRVTAVAALAEAEGLRKRPHGCLDGRTFSDLRDLDDLVASILEVLTPAGEYYWLPLGRIERLVFTPPSRPHDLVWRSARVEVRGGADRTVRIPALYERSHESADDRIRLGRMTQWQAEQGAPVRGLGQKMLAVGDQAMPILEIGTLEIGSSDPE